MLLTEILNEITFNKWVFPSDEDLRLEYKVEYKKHIVYSYGNIWPEFEDFKDAVHVGEIKTVDRSFDMKIGGRSNTRDKESLLGLISGYRSYPKYRNEKTLDAIYAGFENNKPMKMPLVLKGERSYQIMSGNTRMDIAFQLGIHPKVIIIDTGK